MKLAKYQQGMSMMMTVYMIATLGLLATLGFKLIPHYLDNRFVAAALQTLQNDSEIAYKSHREIRSALTKSFMINNVREVSPKDVRIKKEKNTLTVDVDYDVTVPIFYNIDAVVKFRNHFEKAIPTS